MSKVTQPVNDRDGPGNPHPFSAVFDSAESQEARLERDGGLRLLSKAHGSNACALPQPGVLPARPPPCAPPTPSSLQLLARPPLPEGTSDLAMVIHVVQGAWQEHRGSGQGPGAPKVAAALLLCSGARVSPGRPSQAGSPDNHFLFLVKGRGIVNPWVSL